MNYLLPVIVALLLLAACTNNSTPAAAADTADDNGSSGLSVSATVQRNSDADSITTCVLSNDQGMTVELIDNGAIVTSIVVPDRDGQLADVVLGYDDPVAYRADNPYFGAFIGRYGNRIAKGRFTLGGKTYELATNNGPNHLHGGVKGFNRNTWSATPITEDDRVGVKFSGTSPDGEEGYPGNLNVSVTYWLNAENELALEYTAETDQPTPVNLTNHSYFNLAGEGDILSHELMIAADRFTPVDETLIPVGEHADVTGTPFDFREPTPIGARIDNGSEQLKFGGGYDHNFVLGTAGEVPRVVATVYEPTSGRTLEIETTEPGLQFYSGNFLDGSNVGKGGGGLRFQDGLLPRNTALPGFS